MYIQILKPDFVFSDERGELIQLVHNDFRQVNYILSYAGVFRGGHYHKINRELFYVIRGKLELIVYPAGNRIDNVSERYVFETGSIFEIPENIVHNFNYIDETALISMYSVGVELPSGEKDIFNE